MFVCCVIDRDNGWCCRCGMSREENGDLDWVRDDDLVIVRLVVDAAGVLLNERVDVGDGGDECVRLSDCVSVVPTVVMGVSDNVAVVETEVDIENLGVEVGVLDGVCD